MSITVTITATSVSELKKTMSDILKGYEQLTTSVTPPVISQEKVSEILADAAQPTAAPVEKKTRTRKPKEEKAPEVNAPAVAEQPFETKQHDSKAEEPVKAPPAQADDGTPTKEKVHQALQQVNVAVNLNKAREILTKFKCNRVSEIQPSQYQAFIDECNAAVAMS